ncbi:CPBP family intramembrane metalloprotease [Myxococcaceae bacterium GXIMD 01537]
MRDRSGESGPKPDAEHPGWLVAACVGAVAWTAFVRLRPPHFFAWASLYCAGWLFLSWRALGAHGRARHAPRWEEVLWGAGLGVALYGAARAFLWAFCGGLSDVLCAPLQDVYQRFGTGSPGAALALAAVIAPAEEVFWRGVVQGALRERLGRVGCAVVTAALSSLLLLAFGEELLALAALPTSLFWGLLAEWRRSLVAAWVSHAVWDVLIVVLLPAL